MPKVQAPALSLMTHGTIGHALTFQSNHKTGRAQLRKSPAQPRSNAQLSLRKAMAWGTQQWKKNTYISYDQWAALGKQLNLPAYQVFIQAGQRAIKIGQSYRSINPQDPPSQPDPPTTLAAQAVGKRVRLTWTYDGAPSHWCLIVVRSSSTIGTIDWTMYSAYAHQADQLVVDHPPTIGTWFYRLLIGNDSGWIGPPSDELIVTTYAE